MNIKSQKGQSLVEFVLILPLLIILLFGIIEFSVLMYNQAVITNASREGARAGIVMSNPRIPLGNIQTVVANYCQNNLVSFQNGVNNPVVEAVSSNGAIAGSRFGHTLTVTVQYNYQFFVIPKFITLGNRITLRGRTIMAYE